MKKNVILNKKDIEYIKELAQKREKYKHSKWQKNSYRTGIANSVNNNYYVARMGLYGEFAFSKYFNLSIDETIYDDGDYGYDFNYNNIKIDIKCQKHPAYKLYNERKIYGPFYIVATDQYGNEKQYKSDIFVFCSISFAEINTNNKKIKIPDNIFRKGGDLEATEIGVTIHGFIKTSDILKNKKERRNYRIDIICDMNKNKNDGNNYNYYIKEEELKDIDFLPLKKEKIK